MMAGELWINRREKVQEIGHDVAKRRDSRYKYQNEQLRVLSSVLAIRRTFVLA